MTAETIAAISTPPGRGGIGIVRLSGPRAEEMAGRLLLLAGRPLEHGRVRRAKVIDPERQGADAVIDDAVVTLFRAPRSYTGEDVIEIATHGSPPVLAAVLSAALAAGARIAEPGEFTHRAFANGRMDLAQAEAVHDLIAARTLAAVRQAAQQLGGSLARRLSEPKQRLLHLIALLEAGMDFASGELDDVDVVAPAFIAEEIAAVTANLERLAATYRSGRLLQSGATLALVGRPNAGKSSLFNALLERDRAIVTAIPGTTRDTLEEEWQIAGIPVRLVDTAGLRGMGDVADDAADEAEAQGIARSREALADADLVLFIHEAGQPLTAGEQNLLENELQERPVIAVLSKNDVILSISNHLETIDSISTHPSWVRTSAKTGDGIETLRHAIVDRLHAGDAPAESAALTRPRQRQAIDDALLALAAAAEANRIAMPHEALLLDLHTGLVAIDSLTGQTTPDDILARIFSTFCIGK